MRKFSKKLAFVLAAAMVFTAFAPAASAKAADDEMIINKKSQILYVNEGINHMGAEGVAKGKGNVSEYDFWVKNKPTNYAKTQKYVWTSSNEEVATVDQKGLTKAVSVGKATIKCTVTDKATGKEVAAPTVKVEVKANADTVVITNGDKYEGKTYDKDAKIDLNRTMFDENGEPAPKRGVVVTDYTRWIAKAPNGDLITGEGSNGVTIDQSKGLFTFGADAADGKYQLYCETYQSSNYTKTTATSDVVEINFEKKLNVRQTASNAFVIENKEVPASYNNITVHEVLDVNGKYTEEYWTAVKDVDKNVVTMFDHFKVGYAYVVRYLVDGVVVKEDTFVAKHGEPTKLVIATDKDVVVETEKQLTYRLYDKNLIDVTELTADDVAANSFYEEITYSTAAEYDEDFYLYGDLLCINKVGKQVVVDAKYTTYEFSDVEPRVLTATKTFTGVPAPKIEMGKTDIKLVKGNPISHVYADGKIPYDDCGADVDSGVRFDVTLNFSDNTKIEQVKHGQEICKLCDHDNGIYYYVRLRAANRTYFEIHHLGDSSVVKALSEGSSAALVDLVRVNKDGSENISTIGSMKVTIMPERKTTQFRINESTVYVGNTAIDNTAKITITAKDQYQDDCYGKMNAQIDSWEIMDNVNIKNDIMTLIKDTSNVDLQWKTANGVPYIEVSNNLLDSEFEAGKYSYTVVAKIKLSTTDGKKIDQNVNIVLKRPFEAGKNEKLVIVAGVTNGQSDVSRKSNDANTKALKNVTFDLYKESNGVKVEQLDLTKTDLKDATTSQVDQYFYTITKDGDMTAWSDDTALGAVVATSTTVDGKMTDGTTMIPMEYVVYKNEKDINGDGTKDFYTLGSGSYTFKLYTVRQSATTGRCAYVYLQSKSFGTTCNPGAYSFVKATAVNLPKVSFDGESDATIADSEVLQKMLRDSFLVKNRNGQDATAPYFVDAKLGDKVVFVKSITFFEEVDTDVYAPYTVSVNTSLRLK